MQIISYYCIPLIKQPGMPQQIEGTTQQNKDAFMSVRSSTRAPGQSVHVSAVMNRMPVSGLCGFTG